ncbi:MAG: sigma-54-dependent Fis family transcriptional regulator, partial [Lysobacterales bacterium]
LFLDEVGELAEGVQAKLLRVLETDEVRAVGEDQTTRVNVRVVAATNRDVDGMVESGKFRADLLYRLTGLRVVLPSLRERQEDIPLLVTHFLADSGVTIESLALERMLLYPWPGNVRELKHAVTTASAIVRRRGEDEISEDDLTDVIAEIPDDANESTDDARESERVIEALLQTNGDVTHAAQLLGSSRSALYETMRRLKIDPRAYRSRR